MKHIEFKLDLENEEDVIHDEMTLRDVLVYALKQQAVYSDKKIRYTESSAAIN